MNLDAKIAILLAAKEGKRIERRNGPFFSAGGTGWSDVPVWTETTQPALNDNAFNFGQYEYRVKPTAPREFTLHIHPSNGKANVIPDHACPDCIRVREVLS